GVTADNTVGTTAQASTEPLQLLTPAEPKIISFSSDRFTYSADGTEPIRLNWAIANPAQLQSIRAIGRSLEGRVAVPPLTFIFSGGVPAALAPFCQLTSAQLTCQGVPIDFDQPGQYQFELAVIPKGGTGQPTETAQSERVDIESAAAGPAVAYFRINGRGAPPKYTATLDPNGPAQTITLSWQVQGSDLQVELLPTPGTVPAEATLTYQLGPGEKTETLTLRVTDGEGRQVQRSVVIETVISPSGTNADSASSRAQNRSLRQTSPASLLLPAPVSQP
ncbi:MAG: hypothetical protein AAF651_13360, partial [Cyanobacteria bacterium P01_C01_bin.73]